MCRSKVGGNACSAGACETNAGNLGSGYVVSGMSSACRGGRIVLSRVEMRQWVWLVCVGQVVQSQLPDDAGCAPSHLRQT